MKLLLTILAIIAATSAATIKSIEPTTIDLKTLEQRVYAQYGEGDAGIEQMVYLTTGKHVDFMGNPDRYEYHAILTERGTQIYNRHHKPVNFLPFDSTSAWDKAMLNDNQ